MNTKQFIRFLLLACLCLVLLASCGAGPKATEGGEPTNKETTSKSDADHPVRPIAGLYTESQTGEGSIEISTTGSDAALIAVRWNDGSGTSYIWNMSGSFDQKNNTIRYEDCIKVAVSSDNEGESVSEVCYRDGKGSFVVENGKVQWTDDEEHFADSTTFLLA